MKIYFLSAQPCALRLNSVFFGITDTFERSIEVNLVDRVYIEFSPEGALPVGFFLTEQITVKPPEGCEVYLLEDGVAVYARTFPPSNFTLRPVAQLREGNLLATVFCQGNLQLSVESPKGFFNAYLPPSFDACTLSMYRGLILLKSETHLGVFSDDCRPLLIEQVLQFHVEEEKLFATLPLSDSHKRTADCTWILNENECTLTAFTLRQPADGEQELPQALLAHAFFESILFKGDFAAFLSPELQPEAEKITAFLGDFVAVTLTDKPNVCGLVKRRGERLFSVENYAVHIEKGKIIDVQG